MSEARPTMSDETTEIIETIRDRRDRAIDAHGRTAAAMDVLHLSPFEQAVYVDAALSMIDRLPNTSWCAMEVFAEIYGDWNDYRQSYRWQKLATAVEATALRIDDNMRRLGE